jgi:CO/xanthine dehydrogenase Mo-binding subunit
MTEMGQGTNTILAQIAAETLGIPYSLIDVERPDTALVPNSGPTVASRTAMVIGRLIERAALELKAKLPAYSAHTFAEVCHPSAPVRASAKYQEPPGVHWDDVHYRGEAYGAYSFATYVATVSVDTTTGEVEVNDFVALQEVGRVLHPVLATGQVEGGVAQGIGWALYEDVVWRDGVMNNRQLTNYIVPTSVDMPPVRVHFEEIPYAHGALGAKGIGELPMDGPAPAILNAVEDALGLAFDSVPLLPEHVLTRLEMEPAA